VFVFFDGESLGMAQGQVEPPGELSGEGYYFLCLVRKFFLPLSNCFVLF